MEMETMDSEVGGASVVEAVEEPLIEVAAVAPNLAPLPPTKSIDLTKSYEFMPPEGRNLFFEDDRRRIDYILVYKNKSKDLQDSASRIKNRRVFERQLEEEGLELECDYNEHRELQYTKVHAPFEVLTRYTEIMKSRMPIKEVPEEIVSQSIWEMMSDYLSSLLSPFELNPEHIPPLPKKFTHVFERDKSYLFAIPEHEDLFFSHAARSRIVDYILRRKRYSDDPKQSYCFGINRLLSNGSYEAAFPLHEGSYKKWTQLSMRQMLYAYWAEWRNWYKVQPLDYIRIYYGEKIGLYFAWLGYYTYMLIPASAVGLIVFIYGLATIQTNVIAEESCDWSNNFTMCPLCDKRCPYWNYAAVCTDVKASNMFDNALTVAFSVFMSLWGTFFLEFWKREQAGIQFQWNLLNFEEEEEPPRPEYLVQLSTSKYKKKHKISGVEEPFVPFWRRRVPVFCASATIMFLLCFIGIGVVIGVIVYKMSVLSALYLQEQEILYTNASLVTSATAACINLVAIFILKFVYNKIAYVLTDWECLRTQSDYDSSLTTKLYVLQFVNYYSSIFYIAFFKGRFAGRPGDYNTFFGARQEECQGTCLMELCIQLAIIFVGKQLIQNNLMEILLPRIKQWLRKKFYPEPIVDKSILKPWEKDFMLEELGQYGLFSEYLEILIQFGFVTLFVAAFPLAPLCALINNIIEIRSDANKFVTQYRRPMGARAQNIGVWYDVLVVVSRLAVLTNAFVIAFTSSFVERLVYRYGYSETGGMEGYVSKSLSVFNVSDFPPQSVPDDPVNITFCRYRGYREPPWSDNRYTYNTHFWNVMAAQFIFVVVFQNLIIVLTSALAYLIPDMPRKLREQVRREAFLTNEIILKTELAIARGRPSPLSMLDLAKIRRRMRAGFSGISEPRTIEATYGQLLSGAPNV